MARKWRRLTDDDLVATHGSAHLFQSVQNFNDGSSINRHFEYPHGSNSVIIGRNQPYRRKLHKHLKGDPADAALLWNLPAKRGHGICFSTTGGGKNTNLITPALLSYSGSALVLDPKGENAWLTAERRRQMGHKVVILDPFDQVYRRYGSLVGVREQIGTFNPLAHINPRSETFASDIAAVAEGLITNPEGADSHWTASARELLGGLIAAVVEKAPGVASLRTVRTLLSASDDDMMALIEMIVDREPHGMAARKLRRFASGGKEVNSIRSTALTQTAILDTIRLLNSMETDAAALDLRELATRRTTVYVVLPADKLQTYGRWMRMIIQLAITAIGGAPTPQLPVLFMLDELGTISPGSGLVAIEQAIGLMGGLGIRIWAFFQELSQVQRDYPTTWRTMIANSEIVQAIRVSDADTSDYISRHIGNRTVKTDTGQAHSEPVISGTSIRHLPDNAVLTIRSGGSTFLLPTIPYFEDPGWVGRFRQDPNYPPPKPRALPGSFFQLPGLIAALEAFAAKARKLSAAAVRWAKGDGLTMARGVAAKATAWWKSATARPEPPIGDERGVKRGRNPGEMDSDTVADRRRWAETVRGFSDGGKP